MSAPSSPGLRAARIQLALIGVVIAVGLAAATGLQLELLDPGARWSADQYTRMLGMHGLLALAAIAPTLAGCVGYIAVTGLLASAQPTPERAPWLAWLGLGLWVLGLAVTVVQLAVQVTDGGWTLYTPTSHAPAPAVVPAALAPLAFAASGLAYAAQLATLTFARRRIASTTGVGLAGALALGIAIAAGASTVEALALAPGADVTLRAAMFVGLVVATAALAHTVAGHAALALAVVAILAAALWTFGAVRASGLAVAAAWFGLAGLGAWRRPAIWLVLGGVAPALLVLVVSTLTSALDVPLHDTYFAVAQYHLAAIVIVLAGVAALHVWSAPMFRRTPRGWIAIVGVAVCSAGAIQHARAAFALGARGMPRRYWDYDPTFTAGHRQAAIGAVIVAVGIATIAVAWWLGRKPAEA